MRFREPRAHVRRETQAHFKCDLPLIGQFKAHKGVKQAHVGRETQVHIWGETRVHRSAGCKAVRQGCNSGETRVQRSETRVQRRCNSASFGCTSRRPISCRRCARTVFRRRSRAGPPHLRAAASGSAPVSARATLAMRIFSTLAWICFSSTWRILAGCGSPPTRPSTPCSETTACSAHSRRTWCARSAHCRRVVLLCTQSVCSAPNRLALHTFVARGARARERRGSGGGGGRGVWGRAIAHRRHTRCVRERRRLGVGRGLVTERGTGGGGADW